MTKNNSQLTKSIVAGVLALAMLGGGVAIGYGAGTGWTYKKSSAELTLPEGNGEGGSVVAEGQANGMNILSKVVPLSSYEEYGIDPLSVENVYNLSVTYTPEDTTFQETVYTVAFKNPNSTWAKGKTVTDYAAVTQSAEGSKDAVLTVKQAFSEQIIVTASSKHYPSIKATTTVDYVGTLQGNLNNVVSDIEADIVYTINEMRDGTITPDKTNAITITFTIGDHFVTRMQAKGYEVSSSVTKTFTLTENIGTSQNLMAVKEIFLEAGGYGYTTTHTQAERNAYWQAVSSAVLNNNAISDLNSTDILQYSIDTHRVYNGVTYDSVNLASDEGLQLDDWSGFEVIPTALTGNMSSIIAG